VERPPASGDVRLDAFVGAAAEYLARQYQLASIPEWVFEPERFLDHAWHVSQLDDPAMREYLTFASRPNSVRATYSQKNVRCAGPCEGRLNLAVIIV